MVTAGVLIHATYYLLERLVAGLPLASVVNQCKEHKNLSAGVLIYGWIISTNWKRSLDRFERGY